MIETGWTDVAELLSWFGEAKNVGPRLQEIREGRRDSDGRPAPWTQEQLAAAMSALPGARPMSKMTIWKIENPDKPSSNRSVTVDELIGFAKVLNVTIADLLLPGDQVAQLAAFKAVTDAASHLQEVRDAWSRYTGSLRTARAHLEGSPDARSDMQNQLRRTRADHYRSFAAAHANYAPVLAAQHGREFTLEEFAAGQMPTPLLAAMEDALGPLEPHLDGWATGRHEPPLDSTDFTYSGGA
ncbi:hypothetical protein GCM10010458_36590 [Microbacterium luteolum]